MKEIIDVLNKQEEVLGTATKEEVHQKKLLHYAAEIFILNSEGQVLSQLRKETKQHYPLHCGSSASGHLHSKETPLTGAYRELQEEIGITVPLTFVGKFFLEDEQENQCVHVFKGLHEGPFIIQESEVAQVKWYDFKTLDEGYGLKMTPHSRFGLQLLIASLS